MQTNDTRDDSFKTNNETDIIKGSMIQSFIDDLDIKSQNKEWNIISKTSISDNNDKNLEKIRPGQLEIIEKRTFAQLPKVNLVIMNEAAIIEEIDEQSPFKLKEN